MLKKGVAQLQSGLKDRYDKLLPDVTGEQAHRVRILLRTGLSFAAVGTAVFATQLVLSALPAFPPAPWSELLVDAIVGLVGFAVVWLVRSGQIRPASRAVLGCLFVLAGNQIYWEGNPTTGLVGALALLLFLAMAMVLLDRRGRWLAFLAAATTFVVMHLLWLAGHLPPPTGQDPASSAVFSIFTWLTVGGLVAAVINLTTQALRNQAGALRGHVADLRKAESALSERTATLQALLNAPLETVALLAPDGQLLNINESGARRLGNTPEGLVGRNVYALFPPDVTESRNALIDQVFQSSEPIRFEDSRAGMHFANSVYPVFDEGGERVTSVAIFASDITERKQAESQREAALKALKESEARYRSLFDSSPEGIAVLDAEGVIRDFNPAQERISDLPREKIIGESFLELGLIPEEYLEPLVGTLGDLLSGKRIEPTEVQLPIGGAPVWL